MSQLSITITSIKSNYSWFHIQLINPNSTAYDHFQTSNNPTPFTCPIIMSFTIYPI